MERGNRSEVGPQHRRLTIVDTAEAMCGLYPLHAETYHGAEPVTITRTPTLEEVCGVDKETRGFLAEVAREKGYHFSTPHQVTRKHHASHRSDYEEGNR